MRRAIAALLLVGPGVALGCTTLLAGPGATVDGSVLVSHSNDADGEGAGNLQVVKAADWPPNATVSGIPQVAHTYAYHTEAYAAMNEHQVGLGESTCPAAFNGSGGGAMLDIVALSDIGLQRARTAREAILTMGALAERCGEHTLAMCGGCAVVTRPCPLSRGRYGFRGDGTFEGSGESLMVADPTEGWIFHILPDAAGGSAIWCASRIPDDHVAVVANAFAIRQVRVADRGSDVLFSDSMLRTAAAMGWWGPGQPTLDFAAHFGGATPEPSHYYSGRRMWAVYRLLAPSAHFRSHNSKLHVDSNFSTSARPDAKVQLGSFFRVMRDYFEGTEFDLTQGLAAGPFGTPDRWRAGAAEAAVGGAWERPIALYRTRISYVLQLRAWLPAAVGGVVWTAPHAAHTSCYVPFAVGMGSIPASHSNSSAGMVDMSTAFWLSRALFNRAQEAFRYMIVDIRTAQEEAEATSRAAQAAIDAAFVASRNLTAASAAYASNAAQVMRALAALFDSLLDKYPDGYCNSCGRGLPHHLGYPAWWLRAVNYSHGVAPVAQPQPVAEGGAAGCTRARCLAIDGAGEFERCVRGCFSGQGHPGATPRLSFSG